MTAHSSLSLRLACIGVLEHALRLLDYVHIETRETMSAEIDIIVLHVWVNDLGLGHIALEAFFAQGMPVQKDDQIPVLYTGDHLNE